MDKDGKTEKPTPKRIKDSRKRGEVAKSPDIAIALSLVGFAFLINPFMVFLVEKFVPFLINNLESLNNFSAVYRDLPRALIQAIFLFFIVGSPFYIIAIVLGILANILQVGLLFTWKPLKPDFKKLNILTNFKQMFSLRAIMNTIKIIGKLGIIIYFCYQEVTKSLPKLLNIATLGTKNLLVYLLQFAHTLFLKVAICLVILSIVDYVYQRSQHQKTLKMSKQEIKDEYKQMEGDPKIKAQRRAQYQVMLRNAIANVQKSTVLITNPTHYAIAIRYEQELDEVPTVLAKGADLIAQKMKEEAKKYQIPMIENRPIARELYAKVEPGQPIPLDLYEALAEIIATVYQLEEQAKRKV